MYRYTHFIPENMALDGASRIGVYDSSGKKVSGIPLGRLTPINKTKLYSFCALADVHISYETAEQDLRRALSFAEDICDFTCIAGDLTASGADENQLELYSSTVSSYAPSGSVYAITGNHEHYSNYSHAYLQKYTGKPLYYSFTKGNDVFIMVGHYGGYREDGVGWLSSELVSAEELQWLYETLELNRNKRCFIFNHAFPGEHGVGNPEGAYKNPILWETEDGAAGQAYISLLRHYKNAVLFHGHSHTGFEQQTRDRTANYSDLNGYRSIHIPSLAVPREISDEGSSLTDIYEASQGYIVDVYDDCIVLKGRDFIKGEWIPVAVYRIDTALTTVDANTFTDSTGIINTQLN